MLLLSHNFVTDN